jgi:ornithine--oxo-acid transaminase
MVAIEFGRPQSVNLRASWNLIESAREGLFCQLITIPLFADHKILCQIAGPNSHAVKFLPFLVLSDSDSEWTISAVETVAGSHRVAGAVWSLGRRLLANAAR